MQNLYMDSDVIEKKKKKKTEKLENNESLEEVNK